MTVIPFYWVDFRRSEGSPAYEKEESSLAFTVYSKIEDGPDGKHILKPTVLDWSGYRRFTVETVTCVVEDPPQGPRDLADPIREMAKILVDTGIEGGLQGGILLGFYLGSASIVDEGQPFKVHEIGIMYTGDPTEPSPTLALLEGLELGLPQTVEIKD